MKKNWVRQSAETSLKGLLIAAAVYFIYSKFQSTDYEGIFSYRWHAIYWYVPGFFLLWALNLLLDAFIWKKVNHFIADISLKRALKTNFVCYALSFITPANSGELAGRYIMLNQNTERSKTLFLIFWSHLPRFAVKIALGGSALILLAWGEGYLPNWVLAITLAAGLPLVLILYFSFIKIQRWLHVRQLRKVELSRYILQDRPYFSEKLNLLVLALLKYLTYSFQFIVLILMWAHTGLSLQLVLSVIVFYFVTALIPTFAAADFLIKAALAIYVFSDTVAGQSMLINAAFVIWLFNIALPALIGSIIIFKANLMTSLKKKFSRGSLYGPSH